MKKRKLLILILFGIISALTILSICLFSNYLSIKEDYYLLQKTCGDSECAVLDFPTTINLSIYLNKYIPHYEGIYTENEIKNLKAIDGQKGYYECFIDYPNIRDYECPGLTTSWGIAGEEVTLENCIELWNIFLESDSVNTVGVKSMLSLQECGDYLYFIESKYSSAMPSWREDSIIRLLSSKKEIGIV